MAARAFDGKLVILDRAGRTQLLMMEEGERKEAPPPPAWEPCQPSDAAVVAKWVAGVMVAVSVVLSGVLVSRSIDDSDAREAFREREAVEVFGDEVQGALDLIEVRFHG